MHVDVVNVVVEQLFHFYVTLNSHKVHHEVVDVFLTFWCHVVRIAGFIFFQYQLR